LNPILLDITLISSALIGYFISIALFTTSFYKSRANNYLSLALFLLSSLTVLEWLTTKTDRIEIVILGNIRLEALFAATLLTYFLIQIKHPVLKNGRYKWIYVPFLVFIIIEIPVYLLNLYGSISEFILLVMRDSASIIFNTILIFWSRKLILEATSISKDKQQWLLRLNLFILCLIIFWILTRIEAYIFLSFNIYNILWIGMSLFFWWILYYGIFRLQIITQKEAIHDHIISTKKPTVKTKINSTTTSKVIKHLYILMEDEELFKDPLLSRLELAKHLNTSESYLSQIVNQELNKSIIQFVNEYRIKTAKNLLQNPVFNKYSVEAIGLEVGFRSKSAFYNAFKTNYGVSPGTYRKLEKSS